MHSPGILQLHRELHRVIGVPVLPIKRPLSTFIRKRIMWAFYSAPPAKHANGLPDSLPKFTVNRTKEALKPARQPTKRGSCLQRSTFCDVSIFFPLIPLRYHAVFGELSLAERLKHRMHSIVWFLIAACVTEQRELFIA